MSWYIFPLISAVLIAVSTIFEKRVLIEEHAMEFSLVFAFFNAALSIPFLVFANFSNLNIWTIFIIYVGSLMGTVTCLLTSKSNRHMEVSASSPWMILAPGLAAIAAYFFLGEKLNIFQISGLLVMIVGLYVLLSHKHESVWGPLKEVYSSKYIHYIIFALVLYSLGALVDRIVLSRYGVSVITYLFLIHIFLAVNFSILSFVFYDGLKGFNNGVKKYGWKILLVSVLTVGQRFTTSMAISTTMVGLVLPIKRLSALFSTIIGGELFHERNLARKIIACLVILAGVVLIVK